MNFNLKRPCANCPFRTDIPAFLTKGRARQIMDGLVHEQGTFVCHKTTVHDEESDDGEMLAVRKSEHCAGAMILLERIEKPNQMMRIAERVRLYDRTKLEMDSPVFKTGAEFIRAQPR